jgi:hypothetical protein
MAYDPLGRTRTIRDTIIAAGTYADGNTFGTVAANFAGVTSKPPDAGDSGGGGIIFNVVLTDNEKKNAAFDIVIFNTTFTTGNG